MIAYGPECSEEYYRDSGHARDRPALRWYMRLVRRYCGVSPYLDFGCGTGTCCGGWPPWGGRGVRRVAVGRRGRSCHRSPGTVVYERLADLPGRAFGVVVAVHVVLDDDAVATALDT